MKRKILRTLRWIYLASQGVLLGVGFAMTVFFVVLPPEGIPLSNVRWEYLTDSWMATLWRVTLDVFIIGTLVYSVLHITRLGKKIVYRIKNHEDSELAKTTTKETQ